MVSFGVGWVSKGALIDGRGRWQEERKEAGETFIFRHPNNLVGGLWERAGSSTPSTHPPPPSFLSAACYYSEATIFFFLISSFVITVTLVYCPVLCARCGTGCQKEAGAGGLVLGCWWRSVVADQGRQGAPAMWVFCLSHLPGGQGVRYGSGGTRQCWEIAPS